MAVKGAAVLVTFVMTKIYIDTNGASDYGRYISLHIYLLLIGAVAGSGMGIFGLKEFVAADKFDSSLFRILFFLVLFNIILLSPVIFLASIFISFNFLSALLCVGSYAVSAFLVEILRYQLGGNSYMVIKDVVRGGLVCALLLSFSGINYREIVQISALLHVFVVLVITLKILRQQNLNEMDREKREIRAIYANCLTISIANGFQTIKAWSDLYAATLFLPSGDIAIYAVCQKLGQFVKLPLVALNADIAKGIAKSASTKTYPPTLKKRINITRLLGVFSSLACLIVLPVYLRFYGFDASATVMFFAGIIIAANFVDVLFGPVGLFAQMSTLKMQYLLANIVVVFMSFSAAFLLVPWGGVLALAIISLFAAILWNSYISKMIYKSYRIRI